MPLTRKMEIALLPSLVTPLDAMVNLDTTVVLALTDVLFLADLSG